MVGAKVKEATGTLFAVRVYEIVPVEPKLSVTVRDTVYAFALA